MQIITSPRLYLSLFPFLHPQLPPCLFFITFSLPLPSQLPISSLSFSPCPTYSFHLLVYRPPSLAAPDEVINLVLSATCSPSDLMKRQSPPPNNGCAVLTETGRKRQRYPADSEGARKFTCTLERERESETKLLSWLRYEEIPPYDLCTKTRKVYMPLQYFVPEPNDEPIIIFQHSQNCGRFGGFQSLMMLVVIPNRH